MYGKYITPNIYFIQLVATQARHLLVSCLQQSLSHTQ
nr:MAG TPA: hypothetical protein [Caudoviricetes sp.]